MEIRKRSAALLLAALMLFGTLGYIATIAAYAETTDTTQDVKYTLDKVYTTTTTLYDVNDSNTYSKYSINKGYLADVTLRVTDPEGTAADILDGASSLVNVSLDSGSFSFTNTSKGASTSTIKSAVDAVGGGVTYVIKLTRLSYSGTGDSLGFTVRTKSDSEGDYAFSGSVTVSQCVPKTTTSDDSSSNTSKLAVATPYVIISNYNYGKSQIVAGDTFNLTVTLYNTSLHVDVENMMVTISTPDDLMLTSSSNTFYVSTLNAEESMTKTIQVTAKPAARPQSHDITVNMKYQYIDDKTDTRCDCTTEEVIAIPVVQVDRFELTGAEIDAQIMVGEEAYLSVSYVNKGRSDVYNLSASVSGDNISNPGQNQNLGNLSSGATGSADFYIKAAEGGTVSGVVTMTYEDTNMQQKTVTIPFTTEAQSYDDAMGGNSGNEDPGIDEPVVTETSKPVWPYIAAVGAVVLVTVLIILKKKRDKKRSEALDADL